MENKSSRELLNGSIVKNLLKMSVPTMIGFLFQSAYDIVDMIWIGRISSEAIAGVTIFITIFWIVDVLNSIIGNSSVSIISQSYGAGDKEKTSIAIEQTITFKALVAIIAAIAVSIILKPLLLQFTTDKEVLKSALDYGYIRIFFLPIMFSSFTINTAFRCIGDSRKPMIIMVIAAISNIVLDPILMFDEVPFFGLKGFGMGVFGAGLATVISTAIAFFIAFFMILMEKDRIHISLKRLLVFDKEIDKKLITIGLPNGIGTATVASFGIGSKLFNFGFMPIIGLSMGASAIIGQCLGAENISRAKKTAYFTALIGGIISIFVVLISVIFPREITSIFTNDPEVIELSVPMLRILYLGLVALSIGIGFGTVFQGSGHNIPFLISSFVARWVVHIPILYLCVFIFKLPVIYVWITYVISDFSESVVLIIEHIKGHWEHKRVL
jgi:Na+-driven multidrug efflux pump